MKQGYIPGVPGRGFYESDNEKLPEQELVK